MKDRQAKGERHGRSKLTEQQVKEIRSLYIQGHSMRRIASAYDVSHLAIRDIVKGKTWTHVK